jgi:hypothetical protein
MKTRFQTFAARTFSACTATVRRARRVGAPGPPPPRDRLHAALRRETRVGVRLRGGAVPVEVS